MQDIVRPDSAPDDPFQIGGRQPRAVELRLRLINLGAVTIPFAGLVAAIALLWGVAFNWVYLALLGGMYIATASGIAVGYHRFFTHRSFKTTRPMAAILAALGSMAVEVPCSSGSPSTGVTTSTVMTTMIHTPPTHTAAACGESCAGCGTPTWDGSSRRILADGQGTFKIFARTRWSAG